MTDMTTQTARWCATNENWETIVFGNNNTAYTITYGTTAQGMHSLYHKAYRCTCKAFKYGKTQTCKHIVQVRQQRCAYGWEAAAGSPTEMGETCPKCNGPTEVMSYAV